MDTSTLPLTKIQDSANYFQLAQELYHEIHTNKEALRTPEQIRKAFDNLTGSLRQAEKVLVLPQLPSMQEIYAAEMRVGPQGEERLLHNTAPALLLTVLSSSPCTLEPPQTRATRGHSSALLHQFFPAGSDHPHRHTSSKTRRQRRCTVCS